MPNFQIFAIANTTTALLIAAGLLAAYLVDRKLTAFRWWAGFYALVAISLSTTIPQPVPMAPWAEAVSWVCLYAAAALASFGMYYEGERKTRPVAAIVVTATLLAVIVVALIVTGAPHTDWVIWGAVPTLVFAVWSIAHILREKPVAPHTLVYVLALIAGTVLIAARSVWFASAAPFAPRTGFVPRLPPPPPGARLPLFGHPPPPLRLPHPVALPLDQPLILSLATILVMVGLAVALVLRIALAELGRVRERSRVDAMTGLLNRAHFDEQAAGVLADAGSQPVSAVIFDIDHFKRINDTSGHAAGDRVISCLGRILGEASENLQIAGRIGGEEFAVILPGSNAAAARLFAEAVRTQFAACVFGTDIPFTVTLSAGVAERRAGEPLHILVARADKALYAAKNGGRNRVAIGDDASDGERSMLRA